MRKLTLLIALFVLAASAIQGQSSSWKKQSGEQNLTTGNLQPSYLKNLHSLSQLPLVMQKQSISGGTTPVITPVHTTKQYLDSMTTTIFDPMINQWANEYKKTYTYDQTGKISLYTVDSWNQVYQKWVPQSRTNYTYDNFGHLMLLVKCYWETTMNEWVGELKEELTYTGNGEIAEHAYYLWDATINAWVPNIKNEFLYNPDGNVATYTYYLWDPGLNQWVGDFKEEFTYDTGGLVTQYIYFSWNYTSSQWQQFRKSDYTYDAPGNLESFIYAAWNPDSSMWVNEFRHDYTWSGGNMTEDMYCEWCCSTQCWLQDSKTTYSWHITGKPLVVSCLEKKNNTWINAWKEESYYNNYGHQMYYNYYEWDASANLWIWLQKLESLRDVQGNLLHQESWFWDMYTQQWTGDIAQENTYNYAWNVSTIVLPGWIMDETVPFHNMLTASRNWYWDYNLETWIEVARVNLWYSADQSTGIETAEAGDLIKIYPNPASEYIYVDVEPNGAPVIVEIYNVQGALVLQQELPEDHRIDIGHLNKGTYFCILNHDKAVKKNKLSIM
ncbi:MAG: T9SS type A sorting domain-containing protein [Bacteroidales bacterium]